MVAFGLRLTVLAICWAAFAEEMEKTDVVTDTAITDGESRNSSIIVTTPSSVSSASTVPTVTRDATPNSSDVSFGQGEPKRGFSSGVGVNRSVLANINGSSSDTSDTTDKRSNETGRNDSSGPLNDPRIFLLGENHHEDLFEQHRGDVLDKDGRGHENGSVHSPLVRGNGQRVGDRRSSLTSNHHRPEAAELVARRSDSSESSHTAAPQLTHSTTSRSTDSRDNSVRHSPVQPRKDANLRAFHKSRKSTVLLSHLLAPTISTAPHTTVKVVTKRPTTTENLPLSTAKAPSSSDDDYYSYPEYPDIVYNSSVYDEAGVLPEPETEGNKATSKDQVSNRRSMIEEEVVEAEEEELMESVEEEEEEVPVQLPDDSLVDTDLHDHDLIDSVMYIYFGPSERDQASTGRQIAAVGGVAALAAQLLTLTGVARRLRMKPNDASALILLNAELALTLANLLFMVGVQATSDRDICQRVAVGLHYLHLAVCCWLFTNSLHIYLSLRSTCYKPRVLLYCLFSWLLPIPVIMGSLGGRGYETRFYCWMSARRGMLISFMLPVSALILGNTVLTVWGVRGVAGAGGEEGARRTLRVTAVVQPAFAVLWFLGVLALENASSVLLSLLFVTTNALLNWFIFGWWLRGEPSEEDDDEEEEEEIFEEVCRVLLKDCDASSNWRRDAELQMDPICTISS